MASFRRHSTLARLFVAFAVLVFVGSACTSTSNPQPSGSAGTPVAGGRVVVGDFADAKVLNPILNNDVPSGNVLARIYESLLVDDTKTGVPQPRLAEKYEVSSDSKTITFTLRDGVTWSDGSPFTGDDFK